MAIAGEPSIVTHNPSGDYAKSIIYPVGVPKMMGNSLTTSGLRRSVALQPLKSGQGGPAKPGPDADHPISIYLLVTLLVLHIALAWVEKGRPWLVHLHGLAALGLVLTFGTNPRHPERAVQAVAYLCGIEVFWRMCSRSGAVFWEFNKYASVLVLLVALLRRGRFRHFLLPLLYFALLLPAAGLTFAHEDWGDARQSLGGNLSGPLLVAVGFAFMSQLALTRQQLSKTLLCYIIPLVGVAFLCYSGTFGAVEIEFGTRSNKAASGGLAPNQVSAALGFGILSVLICLLLARGRLQLQGLLLLLALWFAIQSGLTFSRTGLYLAGLCSLVGMMPLLRTPRLRWTVIGVTMALVILAYFVIVPALNRFTQGAFSERFQSTNLTNRDLIWKADLEIWLSHPLFGVGVGLSDEFRSARVAEEVRAHTEYTRLLADHGLLGLASLTVLLACVVGAYRKTQSDFERAFCLAMTTFGLLFMAASATRLAVFALALGMASVRIGRAPPVAPSVPAGRPAYRRLVPRAATGSGFRRLPRPRRLPTC